jgi:hypothetical protein
MEVGQIMSITFVSLAQRRRSTFSPSLLQKLVAVFGAGRRRNNRIDPDHMPDELQRDIGLLDSRGQNGDTSRDSAWRAAMLTYPPRAL